MGETNPRRDHSYSRTCGACPPREKDCVREQSLDMMDAGADAVSESGGAM